MVGLDSAAIDRDCVKSFTDSRCEPVSRGACLWGVPSPQERIRVSVMDFRYECSGTFLDRQFARDAVRRWAQIEGKSPSMCADLFMRHERPGKPATKWLMKVWPIAKQLASVAEIWREFQSG